MGITRIMTVGLDSPDAHPPRNHSKNQIRSSCIDLDQNIVAVFVAGRSLAHVRCSHKDIVLADGYKTRRNSLFLRQRKVKYNTGTNILLSTCILLNSPFRGPVWMIRGTVCLYNLIVFLVAHLRVTSFSPVRTLAFLIVFVCIPHMRLAIAGRCLHSLSHSTNVRILLSFA